MNADGIIQIGCDIDVAYTAISKHTGSPIDNGSCTWSLDKASDGTNIGSGDVPYVAASDGQYFNNIPSEYTIGLEPEAMYTVTVTFSGGGQDDVVRRRLIARYKD